MNLSRDYILLVTSFLNRVTAGHSGVENSFQQAMAAWFRVLLVPQKTPIDKALRVTDVLPQCASEGFHIGYLRSSQFPNIPAYK